MRKNQMCHFGALLVVALGCNPDSALAQRMVRLTVQGGNLRPIARAQVSVSGVDSAFITDSAGNVRVPLGDSLIVRVRALGFGPVDTTLWTAAFERQFSFVLTLRAAQSLPAVEVTSRWAKPARYASTSRFDEFYERRAKGTGKFFTREDIEASHNALIVDHLRAVAGVRVIQPRRDVPLSLRFARCNAALGGKAPIFSPSGAHADLGNELVAVYVDGNQLNKAFAVEFLDGMKSSEVEAMEVYQGVSQLPGEARGNFCAAIYIWTRFLPQAPAKPE